jgi:hypothetical protein
MNVGENDQLTGDFVSEQDRSERDEEQRERED